MVANRTSSIAVSSANEPGNNERIRRTTSLHLMNVGKAASRSKFHQALQPWDCNLGQIRPDASSDSMPANSRGIVQNASATTSLPDVENDPQPFQRPIQLSLRMVAVNSAGVSRYTALQSADKADSGCRSFQAARCT